MPDENGDPLKTWRQLHELWESVKNPNQIGNDTIEFKIRREYARKELVDALEWGIAHGVSKKDVCELIGISYPTMEKLRGEEENERSRH